MRIIYTLLVLLVIAQTFAQTYSVGSRTITFNDPARTGGFGSGGGAGRQIQTEIYYPATSAGTNAPVANGKFPVVVFGHGFVMTWDVYSQIYDSLARLGYICALPRTEGGLPPVHEDFGKDLALVLNKLLDADTVASSPFFGKVNGRGAISGHSMGGGSTFLADQFTNRATCYFTMAPAITSPSSSVAAKSITKPMCILSGTRDCVAGYAAHQKPHYDSLSSQSCKQLISITDARHCSFSNGNSTTCNLGEGTSGCASSPLTTAQQLAIVRRIMIPYFNYFLKGVCSEWDVFQNYITTNSALTTLQNCTMSVPSNALVTGDTAFCTGASAALAAQPSNFSYQWSNNQTTQGINVTQGGSYNVKVKNAYCEIESPAFNVAEKSAPSAASLQQNITVACANTGNVTLTATTVATATQYIWNIPQDWTLVSDDSTESVTVVPASTAKVFVTTYNACGSGGDDSLEITINNIPTLSGSITGSNVICSNAPLEQGFAISGSFVNADSLQWFANNWQVVNGQGNNSVTYLRTLDSDTIKVYGINACGNSDTSLFAVEVTDTLPLQLTVSTDTLIATQGFSSYQWYKNDTAINGATNATYIAEETGVYYVVAQLGNNCTSQSAGTLVTIVVNGISNISALGINVYPIPASDMLYFGLEDTDNYSVIIMDMNGRKVANGIINGANNYLNIDKLSNGIYTAVLANGTQQYKAKIVIGK